jgi:hypothetical protein
MNIRPIALRFIVFLSFFLLFYSMKAPSCQHKGLSVLLPTANEIENWERNLDFEEYMGEDLFFYINGGAEIYHEYGFERVIVQDYASKSGKSASLEVYQMSTPQSAFGMYSFKSTGRGLALDLGHGSKLQDYYLNFWKGPYLVTITGFDAEKETIDGIKAIAHAVDTKIENQTTREMPGIYARLPRENLDAQSVKYFRGHLGLVNSYPFARSDIFKVQDGIKGTYADSYDIYILEYQNAGESRSVFDGAKEGFKAEPKYQNMTSSEDRLDLEDDSGRRIVVEPFRAFILILIGSASPDHADQILKNLQNHLD